MGHVRLGTLPRTRRWQNVVAMLHQGADVEEIAAAASRAAEQTFAASKNDPGLAHALWLLTQIPLAARSPAFADTLWELGITVSSRPNLYDLVCGVSVALDEHLRTRQRTDLSEMAQLAATECLTEVVGRELPPLLPPEPAELQSKLAAFATEVQMRRLLRDYFGRLTRRCLQYFLSRELSHHVGPGGRFGSIADVTEFDRQLDLHCQEAARIVAAFSGEWFSKHVWQQDLSPEATAAFAAYGLEKIRKELGRHRGSRHA